MKLKKDILMTALIVLICVPVFANPNFTKTYENSKGVVTFTHQAHAELLKDCAACHNLFESFDSKVDKNFGHKGCKACHKKENIINESKAPTKCSGCHVK